MAQRVRIWPVLCYLDEVIGAVVSTTHPRELVDTAALCQGRHGRTGGRTCSLVQFKRAAAADPPAQTHARTDRILQPLELAGGKRFLEIGRLLAGHDLASRNDQIHLKR